MTQKSRVLGLDLATLVSHVVGMDAIEPIVLWQRRAPTWEETTLADLLPPR